MTPYPHSTPKERPTVPTGQEARCAPEMVQIHRLVEKSVAPAGD
jgi:hypothetical protein